MLIILLFFLFFPHHLKIRGFKSISYLLTSGNQLTGNTGCTCTRWLCGLEIRHPQLWGRRHKGLHWHGAHWTQSLMCYKEKLGCSSWFFFFLFWTVCLKTFNRFVYWGQNVNLTASGRDSRMDSCYITLHHQIEPVHHHHYYLNKPLTYTLCLLMGFFVCNFKYNSSTAEKVDDVLPKLDKKIMN